MKIEIYRRAYRVRKAALRGKEVSIPAEVPMKPGDTVIAFYDGFVLYVPTGTQVDETLLRRAIGVRTDGVRVEKSVKKPISDIPETRSE